MLCPSCSLWEVSVLTEIWKPRLTPQLGFRADIAARWLQRARVALQPWGCVCGAGRGLGTLTACTRALAAPQDSLSALTALRRLLYWLMARAIDGRSARFKDTAHSVHSLNKILFSENANFCSSWYVEVALNKTEPNFKSLQATTTSCGSGRKKSFLVWKSCLGNYTQVFIFWKLHNTGVLPLK